MTNGRRPMLVGSAAKPASFQDWLPALLDREPGDVHRVGDGGLRPLLAADQRSSIEASGRGDALPAFVVGSARQEEVRRRRQRLLVEVERRARVVEPVDPRRVVDAITRSVHVSQLGAPV